MLQINKFYRCVLYCKKERTHNPTGGEAKSFPDARKALGPASYMEKGSEHISYAMHLSGKPRNIP